MKIIIDTDKKTLEIVSDVNVTELLTFVTKFELQEYKVIETIHVSDYIPHKPIPYTPTPSDYIPCHHHIPYDKGIVCISDNTGNK